ncbi:hypothetical protein [Roseomonas marmotae]|uniref:Ankyrin repeat domain-containing protein n=1 Tax=Roseomonas marmotae TaxID=2768161 RepID=A0ABS3KBR4_9PROT|nr:hypothetical protein [Roseomonas marmotae]MBO1074088.1 hypothetical protein [Roseomonas marmotae]QTI78871.1 hypothetical protein IAI58_14625 [Roseomonas marmotae]
MRRSISSPRLLPLAALALLLPALPALAQAPRGPLTPSGPTGPSAAPPPALPGLANRNPATVIPPDANFNLLGPTEALFDSINRGDLTSARDAVSRGADLNGRNVLGLTPLESAVDQGRNDIVFYLLSVRGAVASSAPPPPSLPGLSRNVARPEPAPRPPVRAPQRSAPTAAPSAGRAAPHPVDGGAARPDVGFLGFDAGRGG